MTAEVYIIMTAYCRGVSDILLFGGDSKVVCVVMQISQE